MLVCPALPHQHAQHVPSQNFSARFHSHISIYRARSEGAGVGAKVLFERLALLARLLSAC